MRVILSIILATVALQLQSQNLQQIEQHHPAPGPDHIIVTQDTSDIWFGSFKYPYAGMQRYVLPFDTLFRAGDSICYVKLNGADTICVLDNTGSGSVLRDTLIQDSILVYKTNGVEIGRDTIRLPGTGGTGQKDTVYVFDTTTISNSDTCNMPIIVVSNSSFESISHSGFGNMDFDTTITNNGFTRSGDDKIIVGADGPYLPLFQYQFAGTLGPAEIRARYVVNGVAEALEERVEWIIGGSIATNQSGYYSYPMNLSAGDTIWIEIEEVSDNVSYSALGTRFSVISLQSCDVPERFDTVYMTGTDSLTFVDGTDTFYIELDFVDTDDQTLSINNHDLTIEDGNTVQLPDTVSVDTVELFQIVGDELQIRDNNQTDIQSVDLSPYNTNDHDFYGVSTSAPPASITTAAWRKGGLTIGGNVSSGFNEVYIIDSFNTAIWLAESVGAGFESRIQFTTGANEGGSISAGDRFNMNRWQFGKKPTTGANADDFYFHQTDASNPNMVIRKGTQAYSLIIDTGWLSSSYYDNVRVDTATHQPDNFTYFDPSGRLLVSPLSQANIDADFWEIGTTTPPDTITDNMFTMGKTSFGSDTLYESAFTNRTHGTFNNMFVAPGSFMLNSIDLAGTQTRWSFPLIQGGDLQIKYAEIGGSIDTALLILDPDGSTIINDNNGVTILEYDNTRDDGALDNFANEAMAGWDESGVFRRFTSLDWEFIDTTGSGWGSSGSGGAPASVDFIRLTIDSVWEVGNNTSVREIPWNTIQYNTDTSVFEHFGYRVILKDTGVYELSGEFTVDASSTPNQRWNGIVRINMKNSTVDTTYTNEFKSGYVRNASGQDETGIPFSFVHQFTEGDTVWLTLQREHTDNDAGIQTDPHVSTWNIVKLAGGTIDGGGSGSLAGVPGAVWFGDENGDAVYDTSKIYFDSTNVRLGIGTNAPEWTLHSSLPGTQIWLTESTNNGAVQWRWKTDSQNRRFIAQSTTEVETQFEFRNDGLLGLYQTLTSEPYTEFQAGEYIQVGINNSNADAYIDLVGDGTYTDYGLRLRRGDAGANAVSELIHRGTGDLQLITDEAAQIEFHTNSIANFRIDSDGSIDLPDYGSGTNTGTATYYLAVDASGNVIEESGSGSAPTLVADQVVYGDYEQEAGFEYDDVANELLVERINPDYIEDDLASTGSPGNFLGIRSGASGEIEWQIPGAGFQVVTNYQSDDDILMYDTGLPRAERITQANFVSQLEGLLDFYDDVDIAGNTGSIEIYDGETLNLLGSGIISTSATGNTVTISADQYDLNVTTQSGSIAIFDSEIMTITGSSGITTSGSGNTVTITGTTYSAGTLMDLSGTTFNFDGSEASTDASPEGDEFVLMYDNSGSHEKIDIDDLASYIGGGGSEWTDGSFLYPADGSADQVLIGSNATLGTSAELTVVDDDDAGQAAGIVINAGDTGGADDAYINFHDEGITATGDFAARIEAHRATNAQDGEFLIQIYDNGSPEDAIRIDPSTVEIEKPLSFVSANHTIDISGSTMIYTSSAAHRFNSSGSAVVGIERTPTTNELEVNGTASKTSSGDWLANSDRRLKKNISQLDGAELLERLMKLKGVQYEWNDSRIGYNRPDGLQYGLIAQDIKKGFDTKQFLQRDQDGYYEAAYGTYDAIYIEVIRHLVERIEKLEKK